MKNLPIIGFIFESLRKLFSCNNSVRLEFIDERLNKETATLRFKLLIINNSKEQIRLERLYLKISGEVRPVYISIDSSNNPNDDSAKWIPFDNTYLMNKILYSVNSPGSRKIKEVGIFDNYIGVKNVATPIPKCKVENIKDVDKVEIVLEYLVTNIENTRIVEAKKSLVL